MGNEWNKVPVPTRVSERAYTRADRRSDGCWISTYSVASHGYAQIGWQEDGNRHVVLAHRAAWTKVNGQVPQGMTLDHTCKERRCVNPAHMRLLSNFENARRTNGADWELGNCKNGHPNTYIVERAGARTKSGEKRTRRMCSLCSREWQRRYRRKRRLQRLEASNITIEGTSK